jgi:hypothetical protein
VLTSGLQCGLNEEKEDDFAGRVGIRLCCYLRVDREEGGHGTRCGAATWGFYRSFMRHDCMIIRTSI